MGKKLFHILFPLLFMVCTPTVYGREAKPAADGITVVAEHTYRLGSGDTEKIAGALALHGARRRALNMAAKYLDHKGLLKPHGRMENEIFCLATEELDVTVLEDRFDPERKTRYIKVRATAEPTDFIRAEITNQELEKQEAHFSWREEMVQEIEKEIHPARELSRAYRYIRKRQWRIAIIYLDHLEKKYPNWGELYLAKAIGYYGMDDLLEMQKALKKSCSLHNREACEDLDGMMANP